MRHFKSKKKIKLFSIKKIIIILLFLLIIEIISTVIDNVKLTTSNEEFLKKLLQDSNHHLQYKKQDSKFANKIIRFFSSFNITEPETILVSNNSIYERDSLDLVTDKKVDSKMYYVKSPTVQDSNDPIVYIYNSHQQEEYSSETYENYNIKPGVMMASYILKDYLEKENIKTLVEEGNIVEFLNINNWNYNYSYDASRYFLNEALKDHPTIKYVIDLHRDSIIKEASTINISNKSYARVIFVVGLEHENYKENLNIAENINKKIETNYPGLSRGILTKSGEFVNGKYNQDALGTAMLIEVGGYQNTIDEVVNTLEVLSKVIKEYINEQEKRS